MIVKQKSHRDFIGFLISYGLMISILGGCTRTPMPNYYILNQSLNQSPSTSSQVTLNRAIIGIGPVRLPGRLDRTQIVSRAGGVMIKMHSFHRWGDTLQRQLEEGLTERLNLLLGNIQAITYPWERSQRPLYQVLITVHTFEGELTQSVKLDATWQIIWKEHSEVKLTRRFQKTQKVEKAMLGEELTEYVRTMSRLTDSLSQDIANGLVEVEKMPKHSKRNLGRDSEQNAHSTSVPAENI